MRALLIFMSDLVLFVSLTTLVFAVGASAALLLRRRRPGLRRRDAGLADEPVLLHRYIPPEGR